jgi:hypothetical protein
MSCLPGRCLLCLQPGDNVLKQQLQKLQEKAPSAWQVYYDDTAAAGKASKALFDSWDEFEEHVVHTHLVRLVRLAVVDCLWQAVVKLGHRAICVLCVCAARAGRHAR